MHNLQIDMRTANSIFTRAQSAPELELIGVLRSADTAAQHFEPCDANIGDIDISDADIPVLHSDRLENCKTGRLLTVRTDTRGVMQLHAYQIRDDERVPIEINTEQ